MKKLLKININIKFKIHLQLFKSLHYNLANLEIATLPQNWTNVV